MTESFILFRQGNVYIFHFVKKHYWPWPQSNSMICANQHQSVKWSWSYGSWIYNYLCNHRDLLHFFLSLDWQLLNTIFFYPSTDNSKTRVFKSCQSRDNKNRNKSLWCNRYLSPLMLWVWINHRWYNIMW